MLLDENDECTEGKEITTAERCRQADDWAATLKIHPTRPTVEGDWQGVPYGCSVQVKGDKSIHFNEKKDTDNSRFENGEFVRICEKGLYYTYLLVYCHPFISSLLDNIYKLLSFSQNRKIGSCRQSSHRHLGDEGTKHNH